MGHPRGTHSHYVIGCCLIPLGICGLKNNLRRITYGIGCVWGMPSLSPLSSLGLKQRKIEFKPRLKLNHNICNSRVSIFQVNSWLSQKWFRKEIVVIPIFQSLPHLISRLLNTLRKRASWKDALHLIKTWKFQTSLDIMCETQMPLRICCIVELDVYMTMRMLTKLWTRRELKGRKLLL